MASGGSFSRVLISGATGLIGSALEHHLTQRGASVHRLVRKNPRPGDVLWNPSTSFIKTSELEGWDAVIHLAGESIAGGRWTRTKKQRIRDSRVESTRFLSEALAQCVSRPKVLVTASAVGFYGDRGEETLTEGSEAGQGFLPDVCQAWEAAVKPARDAGIRTLQTRFGVVLSTRGGALRAMLPAFRLGVAGRLGDGQQWMSWVTLRDLVGLILHVLDTPTVDGPINVVSPEPVTNERFTKALGEALHRPTVFPAPAWVLRLLLGEMADALLLSSARVLPTRALNSGYRFQDVEIAAAFKHLLADHR